MSSGRFYSFSLAVFLILHSPFRHVWWDKTVYPDKSSVAKVWSDTWTPRWTGIKKRFPMRGGKSCSKCRRSTSGRREKTGRGRARNEGKIIAKDRGLGSHLLGDENKATRFMGRRVDLLFAFLQYSAPWKKSPLVISFFWLYFYDDKAIINPLLKGVCRRSLPRSAPTTPNEIV